MHKNKTTFLLAVCITTALMVLPHSMKADTLVATINGYYDVDAYDTPSLHIFNTTGFDFTNATLMLTGYQGLNKGNSASVALGTITAGSTGILTWGSIPGANGSTSPGNLFGYDYDDEYSGDFSSQVGYGLAKLPNNLVLAPQCAPQANIYGWNFCADTGNFYVTFTATWNGQSIYSQFSPDPTLSGAGNAANAFVGWEGLDPNGWAETTYDSHSSGGPNGVLANIYVGTPPPVTQSPEPATLTLLGSCLVVLAGTRLRKFRKS